MDIFDKKCSLCDKFDKVQEIKMLYNIEYSCTVLRLYHKNEQEICYDQDYQEDNTDGHRIDILDLVWILRITFNLNMLSGGFAET